MKSSRGGVLVLTEIAEVVVLALLLYVVINFAIQTVHVIGLSMYPTVNNEDYLVATKIDYRFHAPDRGDVIIMRDPFDSSRDFIKRVVGVPGDRLVIRDGHSYINGHLLEEPYINSEPWTINANWPAAPTSDPEGRLLGSDDYFVMGDNRNHSSDSRLFGFVHRNQIEARAWIRVLPVTKLGPIDTFKPHISSAALLPASP
ncbi:MAG: signal peptidase I [Candidatus Dormibacteraeota bacterium]|nr:signal peptidase I [Candidatus Dormibacteraeota bacterium]